MNDTLTITYRHNCNPEKCDRVGQDYVERPRCNDGVAFIVRPHCIAAGGELTEIRREVH